MAKRIDIYSILISNGYKLPKSGLSIMESRADIGRFIEKNIPMTPELRSAIALYMDAQWRKLVLRLVDNGHVRS